jgi:hypothetical protein
MGRACYPRLWPSAGTELAPNWTVSSSADRDWRSSTKAVLPLGLWRLQVKPALTGNAPSRIRTCDLLLRRAPTRRDGRASEGTGGQAIAGGVTGAHGVAWTRCAALGLGCVPVSYPRRAAGVARDGGGPASPLSVKSSSGARASRCSCHSSNPGVRADIPRALASARREQRRSQGSPHPPRPVSSPREPRPHACAAICGPTTVTSGIGCSAHCGGSTPAASAAMRAQWRSKPAGVQRST